MKAKIRGGVACFLGLAVLAGLAWAQSVPQLIHYQGRVTDAAGQPLADGSTVDLTFIFYSLPSGGTTYLGMIQRDVVVTGGMYSVLIGSGEIKPGTETSLADVFQKYPEVWMAVQVDNEPEMTPRWRVTSSPYALRADAAATVGAVDPDYLKNLDLDGDGHYKLVSSNTPNDDCNDQDPAVHPGAVEICGDGVDSNCVNGDCYVAAIYDTPDNARKVYISGNYAYVADFNSGLQIINVSNPAAPIRVGSYNTAGIAYEVRVSGNYAYVADWTNGLVIINVSNPAAPTLAGTYPTSSQSRGVYVSGSYAYVADYLSGLQIINVSNPSAPFLAGTYNTPDYALGVFVSGNYAYVADNASGLQIINVSTPSAPTLAGTYTTSGYATEVYVAGSYAYVAVSGAGLQIVNVSNPAAPFSAGIYNTPGYAYGVFVSGNYAYVADNTSGLQIIDVTNPSTPTLAAAYDTPGNARGVFVSGNYAYVADYAPGLQILFALSPP
jgi:hypothetical protein